MKPHDDSTVKNPAFLDALPALRRSAAMARKIAIQTDTPLVIARDGKVIQIPAEQLRREKQNGENS